MPPHVALYDNLGDPLGTIPVSVEGGEVGAAIIIDLINDRDDAFVDTTTATDVRLKLLVSEAGGAEKDSGVALMDERWTRVRVLGKIVAGVLTAEGAGPTLPFGTNAMLPVGDMAPQNGWRIELRINPPGGRTANALRLAIAVDDNVSSVPLASMTALASGSAIVPAERVAGLRAFLRGSGVTANDTATVTIANGALVFDGATKTFPQTTQTFNLNDSAAVALLAGENYRVTLSRQADGDITVTKGPKNEALVYPAVPADELFVARLTVASADGIAVTVAQASVIESDRVYAQYHARAASGRTLIVATGEGLTSPSDHRQFLSHEVSIDLPAATTSRVWRLADGSLTSTATDTAPEFGADLMWYATTDATTITGIVDARVFAHRALVEYREELILRAVMTGVAAPAHGLALIYVPFDSELESVEMNLSAKDAGWTGGALKIDLFSVAPGVAVPFPAGGAGGTMIYTSSGTDDRRPSIAYNAASLRVVSVDHEVRRFVAGTRVLLSLLTTVTGPGAEPQQELRVTLHLRRYR